MLQNQSDRCLLLLLIVVLQRIAHDEIVLEPEQFYEPNREVERGAVREQWNYLYVQHREILVLEGLMLQLKHFGR